jgi:hypothetical protein
MFASLIGVVMIRARSMSIVGGQLPARRTAREGMVPSLIAPVMIRTGK